MPKNNIMFEDSEDEEIIRNISDSDSDNNQYNYTYESDSDKEIKRHDNKKKKKEDTMILTMNKQLNRDKRVQQNTVKKYTELQIENENLIRLNNNKTSRNAALSSENTSLKHQLSKLKEAKETLETETKKLRQTMIERDNHIDYKSDTYYKVVIALVCSIFFNVLFIRQLIL